MTTRKTFSGPCRGGPWDGRMFEHYKDKFELLKPMVEFTGLVLRDNAEIKAVSCGEYWFAHGQWMWRKA